jgi:predicted nicotinamide N-methyase
MTVKPLCWRNKDHLENIGVFDSIVATDVVYCYELIEPLLQTIIAVSRKGSEVFIGHEIRDDDVYDKFLAQIKASDAFTNVRKLSLPKYNHPDNIVLLKFSRK